MVLILLEVVCFILIVLQISPAGEPIRNRIGHTGIIVCLVLFVVGVMFTNEWLSKLFRKLMYSTGASLEQRRRMIKEGGRMTKHEAKLAAMDEAGLRKWIEKKPSDALAVELLCDQLKAKGDLESYAREREYFLTLESGLTTEEKCTAYNELADLYLGALKQPIRAREALLAIQREMPLSYQATLARQRLEEMEQAVESVSEDE